MVGRRARTHGGRNAGKGNAMKRWCLRVAAVTAWLLSATVHAAEPVYTGWFSDVAVGGYDVVAYFSRDQAIEGSAEYRMQWHGAEWRFASAEHLARFRESPERYAPAYGGYCAYAVADGTTAAGHPEYWAIHEGRLYLNYDAETREQWNADREAHIAAADAHWRDIVE